MSDHPIFFIVQQNWVNENLMEGISPKQFKPSHMKSSSPLFIIFVFCFQNSYCQKKNLVGISAQLEHVPQKSVALSYGAVRTIKEKTIFLPVISFERRLTKRSGLVVECKYRKVSCNVNMYVILATDGTGFFDFPIEEKIISIPILYKYTSHIINFSIGPSIEYLAKSRQKHYYQYAPIVPKQYYENDQKRWSVGALARLSKEIKIHKQFIIEPSVYYNPIISYKRNYFGMSMSAGYKF